MVPDPSSPHEVLGLELFQVLCLIPLLYGLLGSQVVKALDCRPRGVSHYSLDWTTGLDYWTQPKWYKMPSPAFFSVGEKLIMFIQLTPLLHLLP